MDAYPQQKYYFRLGISLMHNSSNSTAIKQQTLNDNIILDNLPPKIERTSQAVNKLQASRRADSWVSREQNVKLKMDLHDEEQTINKLQEKKSQDLNLLIGEVPFAHKNTRDNDSKSVSSKSSSPKIIVPDTDDDDDEDDAQDYGYDVKISTKEDNHRAQNPEISHQLWGKTQQNPFIASVDRSPSPSNKQNQSQSDGNSEVLNNILGTMSQNVDSAVQQRETTKQTKITMENNKNNKNQKIKEKIQVSAFNINSDQTSKQQNRKEEENDQNDYYLPKFPDKIEENQQQQSSKQYKGSLQKLHLQEDVEPEEMNFASTNWRQSTSPDAKLPLHRKQSEGDLEEEGEEEIEGEQLKHSGNRRSASPFKDYKDENISGGNPLGTKRQFQNNDPTESFYKEHNSMLDSSHNLHEFDTHHRQPLASKVGDIKINIESKNNMELSKHIGKDLLSGSTNILGKSKIIQSESLHTKGSVMSIAKPPANRLELEKKKEKQIQKFCQKFFKDQLKNRSGVPTLTQKKRTMVIESDTPNPDFHNQLEIKDDLLNDELRKELSNIEEHQKYRLVMDSFLKKFSRSPKEAIQFLIEKQLCDDTEEDIAFTLLTAEGLNKEQLGIFFGDSKEKNQGILEAFCSLMDFRDLRFDQAIRLFLSRFRLPGESQQIDRIVQKFTKVYARDNPNVFKENDEDTPYILCYASIMLNVDAHSEKIDKKQKMTKENFVKINLSCTRNAVTKEFLEELYDNIVKEEFQTKIDYIEKIYSRLPVDSMSQKYDGQTRKKISKALQAGSLCLKYGRKGKPHQRFVWLSQESDKIFWCEYGTPEQIIAAQQRKNSHYLNVNEIVDIALGSNTTAVMLKNKVPLEFDQYCFSLISQNRTLDLKCDNLDIKGRWIAFVYNLLNDLRLERKNARMLFKTTHPNNMERLSDVWRIDIFSKWEDHWDYAASKPKNLLNFEKKQTSLGCWECISAFCPFSKKKKTTAFNKSGSINSSNSNSNNNNARDREDSSSQGSNGKYGKYYEELEMPNHSDKSLLLISLWKIGMPPWVRKTIWPLTIGNRLEITQNLYNILLKQLQMLKSKQISQNPSKNNSIDIKRGQINQVIELSDGVNPYSLKNKRNEMQLMKAKTTTNPMKFQNSLIETSPITKMQQQPKQAGNLTKHDQQIEPAHKGNLQDDNLSFQEPTNNQINISLEKMQKDLILMKNSNLHATLTEKQHKTLENILGAFILYRPDIGYIPESMPNLAAALVHHLEDESIVFRSFINLLHSYHFLTFFRGEMSEIKWRVQFFNQHLQHRMPLVLQHFKALDLSSELFLMHWFLNLFTNVFDQETVFRIWDNFLLEGEIYAFKAGIAFIEYFHLEFKMSTFDDAIHLLRNPPQDIFCPDLYFDIIEDIKIPVKEFNDLLNQQNIAKLAPQILQQLL